MFDQQCSIVWPGPQLNILCQSCLAGWHNMLSCSCEKVQWICWWTYRKTMFSKPKNEYSKPNNANNLTESTKNNKKQHWQIVQPIVKRSAKIIFKHSKCFYQQTLWPLGHVANITCYKYFAYVKIICMSRSNIFCQTFESCLLCKEFTVWPRRETVLQKHCFLA